MVTRLRLAIAAAATLAVAAGAQITRPWLPIAQLTPGDTFRGVTAQTVCKRGYSKSVRRVSAQRRAAVLRDYGIKPGAARFELDHLVPLELGGSNERRNLWPQPFAASDGRNQLGAGVKNVLENRLRRLVCGGKLGLEEAQREIAANWPASYSARVRPIRKP